LYDFCNGFGGAEESPAASAAASAAAAAFAAIREHTNWSASSPKNSVITLSFPIYLEIFNHLKALALLTILSLPLPLRTLLMHAIHPARAINTLRAYVLTHGVPSNTLYIVGVVVESPDLVFRNNIPNDCRA
jgi:hypothetical protein